MPALAGTLFSLPFIGGAASFVAFWLLQHRLSPHLSAALFASYASPTLLTVAQRREWNARVSSSVHAVFACLVWLTCWLVQPAGLYSGPERDLAGGSSWLSGLAFVVMAGYMLSDAISMASYMTWQDMAPYQLHHCVAASGFISCAQYGTLHYFVMYRVLSELSTPLVNLMWFFRVSGYSRVAPLANAANSAALTLTFASCRLVPIPVYWLRVWSFLVGNQFAYVRQFPVIGAFWFVYSVALDCLNLVWFRRLVLGGLKLWRRHGGGGGGGGGEGEGVVIRDSTE